METEEKNTAEVKEAPLIKPIKKKKKFWWLWVIVGILLFFIIIAGSGYLYARSVYKSFLPERTVLEQKAGALKDAVKQQDLTKIKQANFGLRVEVERVQKKTQQYSYLGNLPRTRDYYADINHLFNASYKGFDTIDILVDAVMPYADILGLSGGSTSEKEKTTLDRITFLVTTLDKIRPELDKIDEKLSAARDEIDQIDPSRYPEEISGVKVRSNLDLAVSIIDQISLLVKDAKPLLEVLPEMMGVTSPKYYFVLFQNDAELRPTGGFMTAYGILKVDKGKITPILSEDIYSLDAAWGKKLPAPDPIKNYHKNVPYLYLRDMNLSPDFAISMSEFMKYYNQIPSSYKVDGVIAVDTKVLVSLLEVLGSIGVPEWGNFSAKIDKRCDCPEVVYRLEEIADKPISGVNLSRKAVIGPLMHSILANAFNSPKDVIAKIFNAGIKSIQEKHVMFYMFDENTQKAIEAFNLGGRVKDYDGDYQLLVNTNFAGAKSNLFIKESIDEKIEISPEGEITKTIIVSYDNPFPASNCNLEKGGLCLNGLYRDWFRLYVPKGSQLIEMTGSEVNPKTYEELGKTVFEGFYGDKFPLSPQSKTKVSFKYKLPYKYDKNTPYKLLIQKQPGVEKYDMKIDFNGKSQEFELRGDKELRW